MGLVLMNAARQDILDLATGAAPGAAGPLNGCQMILYTNPVAITPSLTLADLTEAAFGGYARSAILNWTAPYLDATKNPTVSADPATFVMSDNTLPESIQGYGLLSGGAPGTLVAAEAFTTPVNLAYSGQGLEVTSTLKMSATNYGAAVIAS